MASGSIDAAFIVWGIDQTAYGPVELSTLVAWVRDERITGDTWIYAVKPRSWQRAAALPELTKYFQGDGLAKKSEVVESLYGVELGTLRRIPILAVLTDEQLERFSTFIELEKVEAGTIIVRQDEEEEAMYVVLEGELSMKTTRAEGSMNGSILRAGDFFGDLSLFDPSARATQVEAMRNSILIRISAEAFQRLTTEAPDLATPFLLAVGKSLSERVRADKGTGRRLNSSVD